MYRINPEAEDKEGRTPLHISCQFGRIPIARYLTSKCKCDPNYLDFEEQTPLHHAVGWLSECSEDSALKVTDFLIQTAKCDPQRRDLNGKNALLHACEKGYLTVAQYLIEKCGLSVTDTDIYSNSCLHLAVSYANNLEMVKYIVTKFPDSTKVKANGNTILHAACAANSSIDIIKYILMTVKCDPNSRNEKGIQPLDLTTKKEIKRLLYMHGATPKNVLERHGTILSNPLTTDNMKPFLKVLVVGNSSSGKTTLIKAIQREGSSFVFSFSQQRTTKYDEQTMGLQICDVRNKYGSFAFYDFAGNQAYRCSHSALLRHILYRSTAAVILVLDLSKSVEELHKQIFDWLSLINENCLALKANLQVSVVGSHSDAVKGDVSKVWKALNIEQRYSQYSNFGITGDISLDCQKPDSPGMTKVRQQLSDTYQRLCSSEVIHFNAFCLNDIFETKYVGSLAVSVQDLCHQISELENGNISAAKLEYYIPNSEQLLSDLCIHMNDVGLALYIHNSDSAKSFIVINRQYFLNMIATVFTPSADDNSGVVCLSTLLPQKCDTNLVAEVLTQLDMCQSLPSHCVAMQENSGDDYCYVPALACVKFPPNSSIWALEPKFKHYFGWTLRFGTKISPRLIEILLVRMSYTFFQITQFYDSVQFRCWKNGINGQNERGFECIAEVNDGAIVVLVRSKAPTLSYLKLRSQLVKVCHKAVGELCRGVVTEELFIDPFEAAQYPQKPSSFIAHFTFVETLKAVLDAKDTVKSTTGDELHIADLIGHDPYVDLSPNLVQYLSKGATSQNGDSVVSSDHMEELTSAVTENKYLSELFQKETNTETDCTTNTSEILTVWCKCAGGTYQSLSRVIDKASVFGKDIDTNECQN